MAKTKLSSLEALRAERAKLKSKTSVKKPAPKVVPKKVAKQVKKPAKPLEKKARGVVHPKATQVVATEKRITKEVEEIKERLRKPAKPSLPSLPEADPLQVEINTGLMDVDRLGRAFVTSIAKVGDSLLKLQNQIGDWDKFNRAIGEEYPCSVEEAVVCLRAAKRKTGLTLEQMAPASRSSLETILQAIKQLQIMEGVEV